MSLPQNNVTARRKRLPLTIESCLSLNDVQRNLLL